MSQQQPSDDANTNEAPTTRWWESYAVRYFIGFVVGSICVAILIKDLGLHDALASFLSKDKDGSDGGGSLFLLAVLGLGYCYVASTPISVLHFGRYSYGWLDGHARHFWFGWLWVIFLFAFSGTASLGTDLKIEWAFFALGLIFTAILPVSPSHRGHKFVLGPCGECFKDLPLLLLLAQSVFWGLIIKGGAGILIGTLAPTLPETTKMMWLFGGPVFWIGFSQYFVLFRLFTEQAEVNAFYTKLFHARRQKNAKDVRDTYTHLREHSNSVFIVVVELAILACLLALHKSNPYGLSTALPFESYSQWAFLSLAIWMLPTVFLWGRANAFEKSFADNPKIFLEETKAP